MSEQQIEPSARVYRGVRVIVNAVTRVLFRVELSGAENVPTQRPVIYAATHRSVLDTPFMGSLVRDPARFVAKDALFRSRFGNWIFRKLGAIPVRREIGGLSALRSSLTALNAGESLVIFPEGTRKFGPTIAELQDGCAYLAVKTGTPIVPVGIGGSENVLPRGAKLPRFTKVHVVVGPPIIPPTGNPRETALTVTEELRVALQCAYDDAQGK